MLDSSCETRWGMCMHDPRCADTACEGHPAMGCSTCSGGACQAPAACHQPEPEPAARRPFFTPERIGALIGALLGLAGAAAMAVYTNVI